MSVPRPAASSTRLTTSPSTTDVSCLFTSSTTGDGVMVLTESADTYLGGALDGLPIDQALAELQTTYTIVLDDGYVVEQTTIGGFPAIVVTGTNSMVGIPIGYASTVVDGIVVEVTLDGASLSATPPDSAARRRGARTRRRRSGLGASRPVARAGGQCAMRSRDRRRPVVSSR